MFSLKTINKNKSSYKSCCLCLSKGSSTLEKTSFANLMASVVPAAPKLLIMKSVFSCTCLQSIWCEEVSNRST